MMLTEYLFSKGYVLVSDASSFASGSFVSVNVRPATERDYADMEAQQPPDVAKDTLSLVQLVLEKIVQVQDTLATKAVAQSVPRTDGLPQSLRPMVKESVLPVYPSGVSKRLIETYVEEGPPPPFTITTLEDHQAGSLTPPNASKALVESTGLDDDLFD